MFLSPTRRATFSAHDPTYAWKLILRALSLPLALLALIIYAAAFTGDGNWLVFVLPAILVLILSLAWNIANIVVLFKRGGRYMNPGANVACDLLLWLAFFFLNGTVSVGAQFDLSDYEDDLADACPAGNAVECSSSYKAEIRGDGRTGGLLAGGLVLAYVVMLFHFALFVSACRYTHARRQARRYGQGRFEELGDMNRLQSGA